MLMYISCSLFQTDNHQPPAPTKKRKIFFNLNRKKPITKQPNKSTCRNHLAVFFFFSKKSKFLYPMAIHVNFNGKDKVETVLKLNIMEQIFASSRSHSKHHCADERSIFASLGFMKILTLFLLNRRNFKLLLEIFVTEFEAEQ